MLTKHLLALTAASPLMTSRSSTFPNCDGNFLALGATIIDTLISSLPQLPDDALYSPGAHILCTTDRGACAFTQFTTASVTGGEVKSLLLSLQAFGCHSLGSIPLAGNDPSTGLLTVNIVSNGDDCGPTQDVVCADQGTAAPPVDVGVVPEAEGIGPIDPDFLNGPKRISPSRK